ncbi:amidohydrolase [Actinokineospora bangkokensis]|uniref:Amidohydrolase n=1 Tax=Actinokineospora bangkokensis TaxID=1193682 RepID=A0A1Q9LKW9_9PSEU|nr:amidohydrolase [Actinokineospora bangkokensis]OLR92645.1 amidohydrolase [Actinokineospora bangkokensis]
MLDLLLVGGRFTTLDPARPTASALGVWRGRVVGLDEAVAGLPARRVVDLRGAVVLPGFVDPHVHLAWAGLAADTASVAAEDSVAGVLAAVAAAARQRPVGEWVDVVGYDQRRLGRHVTAADLDTVAAGRRVNLVHDSGHACVVDSGVLAALPADVPHRDGLLVEAGAALVRELRQPYPLAELVAAVERAGRQCLAEGVTAVAEAGIGGGLIRHSPVELAAYQRAQEQGRLPLRVRLMVAGALLRPVAAHGTDDTPRAMDLGLRTGFGGDRLSLGALKVFTDGGMMARTAALTEPYAGSDSAGELYADPDELRSVIVDGHRAGWQLAVHAIGDRAVDVALDAIEAAQTAHPRPRARHRVEHAGLVRPDQLPRFATLGVTPVVQPTFLWSFGDDYAEVMGPERAQWLYRGQSFVDEGVRLVGSSDRPVTVGAPLRAMQFMLDRTSHRGTRIAPAEAVSPATAVHAYTTEAAWSCHWEDELGSLTPGSHADLAVLTADPHVVPPASVGVRATVVAGEVVWGEELF